MNQSLEQSPVYKYGSVVETNDIEKASIINSTRDNHSHRHHSHSSEMIINGNTMQENYVAVFTTSRRAMLRNLAIQGSLVANVAILLVKAAAYYKTLSLSVLAALVDSLLDVVSQVVLYFAERHAKDNHSSALYPAGASRMEPIGVLTCAALMGIASFEVLQESINSIFFGHEDMNLGSITFSSVFSMMTIVLVKVALLKLCKYATADGGSAIVGDSTLEALAQDHLNDALSNFVAAIALISSYLVPSWCFLDPVGAIFISLYIIHSWFSTGKEMIEQLIGKAAPEDFIDEIIVIASKHDTRMTVDVCRAYHFGPKFLVELEVVLPADMPLIQSHDIGMDLQYEIEGLEEVERCFVHIDYEKRDYDEHVVSKVPELRQKYTKKSSASSVESAESLISRISTNSNSNANKIA